jgi:NAD(P) transhydrogenase
LLTFFTGVDTIPSKTVREAIFQLSGLANPLYVNGSRSHADVSVENVWSPVKAIVARETDVIQAQLKRNRIAIYQGSALWRRRGDLSGWR